MLLTNIEMERRIGQLESVLDHKDIVGYAAARNTRVFNDQLVEFKKIKDELITKYGEVQKNENGEPTGEICLSINSPKFKDFNDEFEPYALLEHEVDLFTLDYKEAIGLLSGDEILKIDWMFEDKEQEC